MKNAPCRLSVLIQNTATNRTTSRHHIVCESRQCFYCFTGGADIALDVPCEHSEMAHLMLWKLPRLKLRAISQARLSKSQNLKQNIDYRVFAEHAEVSLDFPASLVNRPECPLLLYVDRYSLTALHVPRNQLNQRSCRWTGHSPIVLLTEHFVEEWH